MNTNDFDSLPCRTTDPEVFYADGSTIATRALRDKAADLCNKQCPADIRNACLRLAMETETPHERWGVWGGTTPEERTKLAKKQRRTTGTAA